MMVVADMTEGIVDEFGQPVAVYDANSSSTIISNRVMRFSTAPYITIASNSWLGFPTLYSPLAKFSFQTPFLPSDGNSSFFFQAPAS